MNKLKMIAMYFPGFYHASNNSKWWEEDFSEWTIVKKAEKYFDHHNQPRVPLDKKYYNLMQKETLKWQADLAKKYKIYGFCFYHYFEENGRRTLEKPAENLLEWKDIDINFCFSWVNRAWGNIDDTNIGVEKSQLFEKKGSMIPLKQEGDKAIWRNHFEYLLPFFLDRRYIKIDNKPVFLIYCPDDISYLNEMKELWDQMAVQEGFKGIYLIVTNTKKNLVNADALLLQMPDAFLFQDFSDKYTKVYCVDGLTHRSYDDVWYNALQYNVLNKEIKCDKTLMYGGFVNFDETPRHGRNSYLFDGVSPKKFEHYLYELAVKNLMADNEYLFINAWNEWGVGNYLEPDEKEGYAFLQAVKRIVEKCSHADFNKYSEWSKILNEIVRYQNKDHVDNHKLEYHVISDKSEVNQAVSRKKIAVFAYLYYLEDLELYVSYLDNVPKHISLYIITSLVELENRLSTMITRKYEVIYKENRGRDISGLLVAAKPYILQYDYICFIHDKKAKEDDVDKDVEIWRDNLWSNVLGSEAYVGNIVNYLDMNADVGLLVPHSPISKRADVWLENGWSGDYEAALDVCKKIGLKVELDSTAYLITYSTVFWAKVAALKRLFRLDWKYEDFPEEPLPDDGTISHAIERILGYVALDAGYKTQIVLNASYAEFYVKQLLCEALQLKNNLQIERTNWETERINWETERTNWETERTNWETERTNWETERTNWEVERANWEVERANWEVERASRETERTSLENNKKIFLDMLFQNFKIAGMDQLLYYNNKALNILGFCKQNPDFYLYGAGIRGAKAILFLREKGIRPKGILVTSKDENETSLLKIPIIGVEDMGQELETAAVLISVSGNVKDEVIAKLQIYGCKRIFFFSL